MPSDHYTSDYYNLIQNGCRRSAEIMVPLVLSFVPARSVVDVGCGVGAWLAVFRRNGVEDILGLDGDYIDRNILQIPVERFQATDLSKQLSIPRTFDLAICLEVAEHIPAEFSGPFIESLTRLAPAVLFSAAIPYQGGNHHVNEQWPDKWAELFKTHGYLPVDFVRRRVWQNESVEVWYAQNTLLFASEGLLESNTALRAEHERTNYDQLRLVHPRQYLYMQYLYRGALDHPTSGLKVASRNFLTCLRNAFTFRLQAMRNKQAVSNGREKQPG
jgi:SAM-dependent methyltransferase